MSTKREVIVAASVGAAGVGNAVVSALDKLEEVNVIVAGTCPTERDALAITDRYGEFDITDGSEAWEPKRLEPWRGKGKQKMRKHR